MFIRFILSAQLLLLLASSALVFVRGFSLPRNNARPLSSSQLWISSTTTSTPTVGPRLSIREDFPGLQLVYSNPDVYVIENFLDADSCQDLMDRAEQKGLSQSPVAYAGWTDDLKDLVELAAKGPVAWLAIGIGWLQTKDGAGSQLDLIFHMVQNFVGLMIVAIAGIGLFTKSRADSLQDLRTSTSTTLDDMTSDSKGTVQGPLTFVRRTSQLFTTSDASTVQQEEASHFEAPTVIRYEAGQVLAPHYDANRSAATEDANRGGQTLATLLVYLNDVGQGGLTRFGKLPTAKSSPHTQVEKSEEKLSIRPKRGDALLFFPADANGNFDDRTEHEGCPAVDEKYIARIWRHQNRVPPPFGMNEDAIRKVS